MENCKTFIRFCKNRYSVEEVAMINCAIEFAEHCLGHKKKISDKPLVEFNIEVGEILAMSELSVEIVVAGILYGVEKVVDLESVCEKFGEDVCGIVFGQLKLRTIKKNNKFIEADLVRKILLTSLDDVRVIFVKLAVKLANLRIISALGEEKQKKIAEDILDIYVPLAMRFGLDYIKNRLEDLSFEILHPRKYREISNFFKESKNERKKFVREFIVEMEGLLKDKVRLVGVTGRSKQIGSIYKKIVKRGVALEKQRDHYAIRIIVKGERDCYDVLGILHREYAPVAGRLKDYIASPKPNGYQSIHSVVETGDSKEIEVQIRTREMDEFAEEGVAAHWRYKGSAGDVAFEKKLGWLKVLMESQRDPSNKEFMKNLKLDLFADKIYCYTPKGDVRELATNATLLDFAYSIHQEVGERAVGGRVDGKFVSLRKVLENGVVVEILTNKNQRPRRDWLKFVVSTRAKSKIRKAIKRYEDIPVPREHSIRLKDEGDYDSLVESSEFPLGKFSLAKCCYPLPKDELLGIMKSHRKFLVHKTSCPRVSGNMKNAVIVSWREKFNRPLNLKVSCVDRPGILADLLNTISRVGFVVKSANAKIVGNEGVECNFVVIPRRLDEVCRMVESIRNVRNVRQVFFD